MLSRHGLTKRCSQPLAVPISSFDGFNIQLRSKARSRQRWLSSFSLDVVSAHGFC